MNKRILSWIIVLSIVMSSAAGAIESSASAKRPGTDDPFALMYDSDAELEALVEEIVEKAEIIKERASASPQTLTAAPIDLADSVMTLVQQDQMDEIQNLGMTAAQKHMIETAAKTIGESRYIIKYKDSGSKSVESYLKAGDVGKFSVEEISSSADENCELLVLEQNANPSELARVLKARNFSGQIEYIQPDFRLGISTDGSFSLELESAPAAPVLEPETETEGEPSTTPVVTNPIPPEQPDLPSDTETEMASPSESVEETPVESGKIETAKPIEPADSIEPVTPEIPLEPEVPIEPLLPIEPENEQDCDAVVVALIDTGVDITHPDISDHLWSDDDGGNGWNFIEDTASVFDSAHPEYDSHGTHVAGIIAANAPEAELMILKAFGREGAYTSDIIRAIQFAEENGASIVNCSFGSSEYNPALAEAIAASDMLFIAAAGNHRNDLQVAPVYPACFDLDNILCVASVNEDGGLSYFSNYSDSIVDVAAVGRDVESALPENEHGQMSGTSMAAAVVTGVASAVLDVKPELTTDDLKERLVTTSEKLSNLTGLVSGGRFINLENAINNEQQTTVTQNRPEDDFNVDGLQSESNSYELYSKSAKNIQVELTDTAVIVLKNDGTVWAWGEDDYGICGEGADDFSSVHQIAGLRSIKQISAGPNFCLARRADGTVWGWGHNTDGQLGLGYTSGTVDVPMQIFGLTNIVDIAAGGCHALAVRSNGRVYAWGSNTDYQLGDGTTDDSYTPTRLSIRDVDQVAAGELHSLFLDGDGLVWSCGDNSYGQLGDSTTTRLTEPSTSDMEDAIYIAAGDYFSLAIDRWDDVSSWGCNNYGQLGNGNSIDKDYPVSVDMTKSVEMVAANDESAIALTTTGDVWTWGDNIDGQLGTGYTDDEYSPVRVRALSNCVDVAINTHNGAAVDSDGIVWIWGSNDSNTLGLNQPTYYAKPVEIPILSDYHTLVAEDDISFGIADTNRAYGWGRNYRDMIGSSTEDVVQTPTMIDLTSVKQIAIGDDHVMARRNSGRVYSWGRNNRGQLGDDTTDDSADPVRAVGLTDAVDIAAGDQFGLALDDMGYVYAWGYGRYGQLGNADTINDGYPTEVLDLEDIADIAAGKRHGLAVTDAGRVWTWGYNNHGQLGDGTFDDSLEAYRISYPRYVVQVDAGTYFSVALDEDGDVWTWGYNNHGQLGHGTTYEYNEAEQITSISNITKIAAGDDFCLALKNDGTVWGWGRNSDHQLGRSSTSDCEKPVQIRGLSDIVDIVAGSNHCFAKDSSGKVYGWGSNLYSQLGIPRVYESLKPMQAHSYIENMYFSKNGYAVTVPETGSSTTTVAVYGNSAEEVITPMMASYTLAEPYAGVSLNSNGTVTVTSSAAVGRVQINATYGNLTASTYLVLVKDSEEATGDLTFSAISGGTYDIAFVAQNVQSFAGKTFTLTYDPAVLAVDDLCALSHEKNTAVGVIPRTGVTITQLNSGSIVFKVGKDIASSQKWSGTANVFSFKATADGQTTVCITQTAATS